MARLSAFSTESPAEFAMRARFASLFASISGSGLTGIFGCLGSGFRTRPCTGHRSKGATVRRAPFLVDASGQDGTLCRNGDSVIPAAGVTSSTANAATARSVLTHYRRSRHYRFRRRTRSRRGPSRHSVAPKPAASRPTDGLPLWTPWEPVARPARTPPPGCRRTVAARGCPLGFEPWPIQGSWRVA